MKKLISTAVATLMAFTAPAFANNYVERVTAQSEPGSGLFVDALRVSIDGYLSQVVLAGEHGLTVNIAHDPEQATAWAASVYGAEFKVRGITGDGEPVEID